MEPTRKEIPPCFKVGIMRCEKCWELDEDCKICRREKYPTFFNRMYNWWYTINNCHICDDEIPIEWYCCFKCGYKKNIKCLFNDGLLCDCIDGNLSHSLCKKCNKEKSLEDLSKIPIK